MSGWQTRLEIYKQGLLDEVDAVLGAEADKERRLQLAREIDALGKEIASETYERVIACNRDLLGLGPQVRKRGRR